MFSRQFGATGQLRTVFWTSYRLLTKDAKFEQIDSEAECFKANFEQQDSCARCFTQGLAFLENWPILRTRTVSQSVLTPILSNGDSCAGCFAPALPLTNVANFKRNDSCAVF